MARRRLRFTLAPWLLLQPTFLALALAGILDWPWWAVLMPTWVDGAQALAGLLYVTGGDLRKARSIRITSPNRR